LFPNKNLPRYARQNLVIRFAHNKQSLLFTPFIIGFPPCGKPQGIQPLENKDYKCLLLKSRSLYFSLSGSILIAFSK
jgi:hypothetical protein